VALPSEYSKEAVPNPHSGDQTRRDDETLLIIAENTEHLRAMLGLHGFEGGRILEEWNIIPRAAVVLPGHRLPAPHRDFGAPPDDPACGDRQGWSLVTLSSRVG
jgi:hypothetical protein